MPVRYQDFQLNSTVPVLPDPGFQALNQLLASGVLQKVDVVMARRHVNIKNCSVI